MWALDNHKTTNDIPTWSDLIGKDGYIREMPTCPEGGTYTIGRVGGRPKCSNPEHPFP